MRDEKERQKIITLQELHYQLAFFSTLRLKPYTLNRFLHFLLSLILDSAPASGYHYHYHLNFALSC
jgi:hypothetical protein